MTFPTITHINDVLPYIEGRDEFVIKDSPGFKTIDYVYALPDSFDNEYRRECRGIKFYSDGTIAARPFHKFFNEGEKPETTNIDYTQSHTVEVKMDGSMVHPIFVGTPCRESTRLHLCTRAGITEQAKMAMQCLTPNLKDMIVTLEIKGYTPIFEFTSPLNQIVIKYDKTALTLIGIRHKVTGKYLDPWDMYETLEELKCWNSSILVKNESVDGLRQRTDIEGVVIKFWNGLFVKVKTNAYVLRHRVKDGIRFEKDVLKVVLTDAVDDALPLLNENDKEQILLYQSGIYIFIGFLIQYANSVVHRDDIHSRKDAALFMNADEGMWGSLIRALVFYMMDNKDKSSHIEYVKGLLLKYTKSQTTVDELKSTYLTFPHWNRI